MEASIRANVIVIGSTFLGITSFLFWGFFYGHHLYQKEQMQLFLTSSEFFFQSVSQQGGFSIYISQFLIQFFHVPYVGAFVISCLLVYLQLLNLKLLMKVSGNQAFLLLSFIPSLVYWALLCDSHYYLSGLVGIVLVVLSSIVYLNQESRARRVIGSFFLISLIYWMTGGAYLILAAIILIKEFGGRLHAKNDTVPVANLILIGTYAAFMPLLIRHFIIHDTLLQAYLSHAYYQIVIFLPLPLVLIFISIPLIFALAYFIPFGFIKNTKVVQGVAIVVLISCSIIFISSMADLDEEQEMKYDNLVQKEKWNQIIEMAEKEVPTTPVSRLAVNLALARTGQLSSKAVLTVNSDGPESLFYPYKREGMSPILRNELYYQVGLFNFAQMYAMESLESTIDGRYSVRIFKRLAETNIISGQYDVARKYLSYLCKTLFYSDWAKKELYSLDDEQKVTASWGEKRRAQPVDKFFHNNSQFDIAMLFLLKADPQNRLAFEYLMVYYLLNKNFDGFLHNLHRLQTLNYLEVPILYQQAFAYLLTLSVDLSAVLDNYPVSDQVMTQLQNYAQVFTNGGRENEPLMKSQFGDTYWYYLHFR